VSVFAIWQWVSAAIAERKATASASQAYVSLARNSREAREDNQELAYLAKALRLNSSNSEAGALIATLLTQASWPVVTAAMKHDGMVHSAQFSADGCRRSNQNQPLFLFKMIGDILARSDFFFYGVKDQCITGIK
jgi:hypothetical protein